MACLIAGPTTTNIPASGNVVTPILMYQEESSSSPLESVRGRLDRLNLEQQPDMLNASLRSQHSSSSASTKPMDTDGDDSIVKQVRKEVTKLLQMLLQAQLPNNTPTQIQKMAISLEQRLFQSSPTLGDYCNTNTLQSRLKVVLQTMKSRLQHKQKRISTGKIRKQVLVQCLGSVEKYKRAEELTKKIKAIKNELVGSACAKCRPVMGPSSSAFEGETLPEAVKTLFFQTPLVDAFDKYSVQRLETVKDWDRLLEQAETNIHAYEEWKAENYVCYRY